MLRQARPELLAVDHPVVVDLGRPARQRGEVAPGAGLGEALAPHGVAAQELGNLRAGQVGRRELGERRGQDLGHRVEARFHEPPGRDLLAEHGAQDRRAAEAPYRLGPAPPHPARVVQGTLHAGQLCHLLVERSLADVGRQEIGEVLVEPLDQPGAELRGLHVVRAPRASADAAGVRYQADLGGFRCSVESQVRGSRDRGVARCRDERRAPSRRRAGPPGQPREGGDQARAAGEAVRARPPRAAPRRGLVRRERASWRTRWPAISPPTAWSPASAPSTAGRCA